MFTHRRTNMTELPKLPEVKFSKNGYEIRSDVLGMAKDFVEKEYSMKKKVEEYLDFDSL